MSKLSLVDHALRADYNSVIVKIVQYSDFYPNLGNQSIPPDQSASHIQHKLAVDYFVVPKVGLYTRRDLNYYLNDLVRGVKPTEMLRFNYSGAGSNKSLWFGKKCYVEEGFISGSTGTPDFKRYITVHPLPSLALASDLLEGGGVDGIAVTELKKYKLAERQAQQKEQHLTRTGKFLSRHLL